MVMQNPPTHPSHGNDDAVPTPTLTRMRSTLYADSAMQTFALPHLFDRASGLTSSGVTNSVANSRPVGTKGFGVNPEASGHRHSSASHGPAHGSTISSSPTLAQAPSHGFVVTVVAAHNAEARITRTLHAVKAQTRPADAVIVVTDDCSDHTAVMALAAGATVVDAADNRQGRFGALNLALSEVVEMLDDSDAIVVLDEDLRVDPDFVARAIRRLWTPYTGKPASRPVGAVRGTTVADARSWSVGLQCRRNDQIGAGSGSVQAGVYLVGALRTVMAGRRNLLLPDRCSSAGVFDTQAVSPAAELAVALRASGYDVADAGDCRASARDPRPCAPALFDLHRKRQHGLLDALSAHGLRRPLTRTLVGEVRALFAMAMIPAALLTVGISSQRGGIPMWVVPLLATAMGAWLARRAWSVRSDGWRAVATVYTVIPELVRSMAAGVGRFAGSARWLHSVPSLWGRRSPRQPTWAHGQYRPGGFDPAPSPSTIRRRREGHPAGSSATTLTLVRVPGPAVVIERVPDDSDRPSAGGWRNHAVVALAVAMAATVMVGIPLAALPVAWGLLIIAATVSIVVNVTTMVISRPD